MCKLKIKDIYKVALVSHNDNYKREDEYVFSRMKEFILKKPKKLLKNNIICIKMKYIKNKIARQQHTMINSIDRKSSYKEVVKASQWQ
jgi:hypothetical protein